jgi:hypothetical protein
MATKDIQGKLRVGAAVRAGVRDIIDVLRLGQLNEAGCDVIVLDAHNGDCDVQVEYIHFIKSNVSDNIS